MFLIMLFKYFPFLLSLYKECYFIELFVVNCWFLDLYFVKNYLFLHHSQYFQFGFLFYFIHFILHLESQELLSCLNYWMSLKGFYFSNFFFHDILVWFLYWNENFHHTYFIYFLVFAQVIKKLLDDFILIILTFFLHSLVTFKVFLNLGAYASYYELLLVSKYIHFNQFYSHFK